LEKVMSDENPWYDTIVIPALLRGARHTYGKAMRKALEEADCDDIPDNGMYVIGALAMGTGVAPLGTMVLGLKSSKQAVGQLVDTLVLRGYLKREADEEDRRRLTIKLTERGWHAAAVQREVRERIDADLVARVGADTVSQARKMLGALVEIGHKHEH
jgi:DNA-binding MarR family transcriptional regulator